MNPAESNPSEPSPENVPAHESSASSPDSAPPAPQGATTRPDLGAGVFEAQAPASAPPPIVHEVEAVPVTRFDAPAPTIDVEARRVPPPEERARAAAEPVLQAAVPPLASESATTTGSAASGASAPPPQAAAMGTPPPNAPPRDMPPMGAPPPHAATPNAPAPSAPSSSGRIWATSCHLFYFVSFPTLFLGTFVTLGIWLLFGRGDAHVGEQGREALNFQINVAVLTALLAVSCLGSPLIPVLWFVAAVFAVLAAVRAYHGENYRYPYLVRVVRG